MMKILETLLTWGGGIAALLLVLLLISSTRNAAALILFSLGKVPAGILIWTLRWLLTAHRDLLISLTSSKSQLFDGLRETLQSQEDDQRQRHRKKSI